MNSLTQSDEYSQSNSAAIESVLNTGWPLPVWLTIIMLALTLAITFFIYRYERGPASFALRLALTGIRLSLLGLVLWMLAGWSWQRFESELPELVIAIDESQSMETRDLIVDGSQANTTDTEIEPTTRLNRGLSLFESLTSRDLRTLRENYSLRWFAIGERLRSIDIDLAGDTSFQNKITPADPQSRLGDALVRLVERQTGRGTAGIVFISDGINTSGLSLADAGSRAKRAAIPIYSVALGQKFVQPDLRLVDLLIDREVYLGDRVTAEVAVVASDIPQIKSEVVLLDVEKKRVLDRSPLELSQSTNQQQVRLSFVPDRAGEIPLEIRVTPVSGEADISNNSSRVSVEVQDKSIRVLLVFQRPSYEFRFLKNLLQRTRQEGEQANASFELISVLQEGDAEYVNQDSAAVRLVPSDLDEIRDIDVFVFGEFDPSLVSRSAQSAIFDAVVNEGAGCLFIQDPGNAIGWSRLQGRPLENLLPCDLPSLSPRLDRSASGPFRWMPTSLGTTALPMQLGGSPSESLRVWRSLPSVNSVVPIKNIKPGAQVLAQTQERDGSAPYPLLVTQFAGAGRTALQTNDETFLWTSFGGSDLYYQRYWGQFLRWLSRGKLNRGEKESKLTMDPKQPRLGQDITFQVALSQASAEQHLADSVEIAFESEAIEKVVALQRKSSDQDSFQGIVSDLGPGRYRAILRSPVESDPPTVEFVVTAPPGEKANLQSDLEAMKYLARVSRGKYFHDGDAERLFETLPEGKKTRLGRLPSKPLWNSNWVALLFVVLITTEWLLRRRVRMM